MMEGKNELQQNAILRARKKELDTYQRSLDMEWLNNRMEDGRMGRLLALVEREAAMEKEYQERTDHAAIVNAKAAKETAMGIEIAKVQREESCAFLRRHYLRERDPGLRNLSRKLQAAYVCRDLQHQILQNHYKKLQEKADEKQTDVLLRSCVPFAEEAAILEEKARKENCAKYGLELRQQLVSRQRQKECKYEDTLIEKKMLDDISRAISDEDQRELAQKRMLMERTQREMKVFAKAKAEWGEKQRRMVLLEEKDLERQQQAVADRTSSIIAERDRRVRLKEELNAKIAAKILADEEARQERENIVRLLNEQEYMEKDFQDDQAKKKKMERVRRETNESLTAQRESKRKELEKQKEDEAEYLKQMQAKIAADDEKEREKQRKIREKNRKHCADVLRQIEENKRKKKAAARDEELRSLAIREYEKKWDKEVNEEHKKIMKEHGPRLIGFMQAGVIKEEDLPVIREGANLDPELAKVNIEGMMNKKRPKRFAKCNPQCLILRDY